MITGVYYLTYFDGPLGPALRGLKAVPTFNLLLDQDFNPIPLSTREAETATYVPFDIDVPEDGPSGEVKVALAGKARSSSGWQSTGLVIWPCFIHLIFCSYGEMRKWVEREKKTRRE